MSLNGDIATWILAGTAIFAGGLAYTNLKKYKQEVNLNTFSKLIDEIREPTASTERGLVWKLRDEGMTDIIDIRDKVQAARQPTNDNVENARTGEAIERTIARMDRVAFFLLGEDNKNYDKLRTTPPKWLRTIVCGLWGIVGSWVEYRGLKSTAQEWNHPYYGFYFKKLNEWYEANP